MTPTDPLFRNIIVNARNGWLTLSVAGQGSASYRLSNNTDPERENEIDRFADAFKRVLRNENPFEAHAPA